MDGTDFRICEPYPFSPSWYSHKFKGPGVRYEIALAIETGEIVWVHGPFQAGAFSDLAIFQAGLKKALARNERVVADGGYSDEKCVTPEMLQGQMSTGYATVRARHETVNERFKNFFVLSHRFRHRPFLHSFCFHAVANLTHLMMQSESPLFSINFS